MRAPRWQVVVMGARAVIESAAQKWAAPDNPTDIMNVSVFEAGDGEACAELLFGEEPIMGEVLRSAGLQPDIVTATLRAFRDDDWRLLEPSDTVNARAGRFFITDQPSSAAQDDATVEIVLQRSEAFGVGEHPSTRGCLLVIDRLAEEGFAPACMLDLGCGSGILSIAAAKVWPDARIVAADIDGKAVAIAKAHARENAADRLTEFVCADGAASPDVAARGPYDLIMMNILAGPLSDFAPAAPALAAPEAFIVLAGFFKAQRGAVLLAYEAVGFALRGEIEISGWVCLVLTNPAP